MNPQLKTLLEAGKTNSDIAALCGVSVRTVQGWRLGKPINASAALIMAREITETVKIHVGDFVEIKGLIFEVKRVLFDPILKERGNCTVQRDSEIRSCTVRHAEINKVDGIDAICMEERLLGKIDPYYSDID